MPRSAVKSRALPGTISGSDVIGIQSAPAVIFTPNASAASVVRPPSETVIDSVYVFPALNGRSCPTMRRSEAVALPQGWLFCIMNDTGRSNASARRTLPSLSVTVKSVVLPPMNCAGPSPASGIRHVFTPALIVQPA